MRRRPVAAPSRGEDPASVVLSRRLAEMARGNRSAHDLECDALAPAGKGGYRQAGRNPTRVAGCAVGSGGATRGTNAGALSPRRPIAGCRRGMTGRCARRCRFGRPAVVQRRLARRSLAPREAGVWASSAPAPPRRPTRARARPLLGRSLSRGEQKRAGLAWMRARPMQAAVRQLRAKSCLGGGSGIKQCVPVADSCCDDSSTATPGLRSGSDAGGARSIVRA
jgi:hypothetical protein